MNKATRYSPEVRERAVRMVFEHEHTSQWAAIVSIAEKIGVRRARHCATGCGRRSGNEGKESRSLDARAHPAEGAGAEENRELRRANEILRKGICVFRTGESSTADLAHGSVYRRSPGGVRSRADLPRAADRSVPLTTRTRRATQIRLFALLASNETSTSGMRFSVCGRRVWRSTGVRKVWRQLLREGITVARCTRGAADGRDGTGRSPCAGGGGRPRFRARARIVRGTWWSATSPPSGRIS